MLLEGIDNALITFLLKTLLFFRHPVRYICCRVVCVQPFGEHEVTMVEQSWTLAMAIWETEGLLLSVFELNIVFHQMAGTWAGCKEEIAMV